MDSKALSKIGYKAHCVQERNRLEAFVNLPREYCGVLLNPLTLQKYAELKLCKNLFIVGAKSAPMSVLVANAIKLFWLNSVDYAPLTSPSNARKMRAFERDLLKRPPSMLVRAARDYVRDNFFESGIFEKADAEEHARRAVPKSEPITQLIAALAREYHWSLREILRLNVSLAFQFYHQILIRLDGDFTPPNYALHMQSQALEEEAKHGR